MALRRENIVQAKTVLLIVLIAISRKFIIFDIKTTNPEEILALAAVTLVLGTVYWLIRERDDKLARTGELGGGGE